MSTDCPVHFLPEELVSYVFRFLSKRNLGTASTTCQMWKKIASDFFISNDDLPKELPNVHFLDKKIWERCFGIQVNHEPPLTKREVLKIKSLQATLRVEGNEGVSLLTVPEKVTIKNMIELAKSPISGNAMSISQVWEPILEKLGDFSYERTHRVVVTNSILDGTRNMSMESHNRFYNDGSGSEMPGTFTMLALIALTYVSSPKEAPVRLFNDAPWRVARCKERIDKKNVAIGGFDTRSLFIANAQDTAQPTCGIAVMYILDD